MSRARPGAAVLAVAAALAGAPAAAHAQAPDRCPEAIGAPNAIVVEVSTGEAACERRADQRQPVGSAVKLMTALVTLEEARLSDTFRASDYDPAPIESQIGLLPGERMTVRDLLRGLLVESGNDAAMALAEGVAGSEEAFVARMNRRAQELGLRNTRYGNPIGLDEPGAYASARDLVTLATHLRNEFPFFRRTVDERQVTLESGTTPRTFENRNDIVRTTPWVNGVKTGTTTRAGYVLVGSGRQAGKQVVSALLGAEDEAQRNAESLTLLRYGISEFQRITAAPDGEPVGISIPVRYRRGAEAALVVGPNQERTVVAEGDRDAVTIEPREWRDEVEGPLAAGTRVGTADVMQAGRRIGRVPLVLATDVPEAGVAQRAKSWFSTPVGVVAGFAVLSGTVLLARRRRRPPRGRRPRRADEEARIAS